MAPEKDDPPDADEGSVLSPEELDITDDERVIELDDGRFVISSGDDEPRVPSGFETPEEPAFGPARPPPAGEPTRLTRRTVHRWLEDHIGDTSSQYGFDITAKFEGSVDRQELFSNDVVTTFENLLVWYAQHVGGDTPVEEVLGLLLAEANASVRYPGNVVRKLVAAKGLTVDDSIADLLEAYEDDEWVTLPP